MENQKLRYDSFKGVALCPPANRLELNFSAGLAYPERYPDYARHKRTGIVCDQMSQDFPKDARRLQGRYIYGGFVLNHYGHFIAESLGRLWITSQKEFVGLTVLFLISKEDQYIKPFIEDAMSHFRLPYRILTENVIVDELIIAEAGKQMRLPARAGYLDWLGTIGLPKDFKDNQSPPKICVLRGHLTAGKIAGEAKVEEILVKAGYYALRPEKYSFSDQLKYYFNAKKIVFSEGSAIHMCDLLPYINADVAVINRRPLSILAETSLRGRTKSLFILQAACRAISPRSNTSVGFNKALSYVRLKEVQVFLTKNNFTIPSDWPEEWQEGVLHREALQYYREYLSKNENSEAIDTDLLISKLMDEVAVHFSIMRELRYKLFLTKAKEAFTKGKYDEACDFSDKAVHQFPGKSEAQDLKVLSLEHKSKYSSGLGAIVDRFRRAMVILFDK